MISDDRSPNVPVILTKRQKRGLLTRAIVEWFRAVYADLGLEGCSSDTGRRTFLLNGRKAFTDPRVDLKPVPANISVI